MATDNNDIRAAFENELDTVSTNFPTAYENVLFNPEVGTPYQACFMKFAEPENPTMGDGHHRLVGIFLVNLHYPLRAGTGDAATRAGLIKAAFPRGSSVTYNGITAIIAYTPEIADGYPDDDGWWIVPVRIRWYADIF